MKMKEFDIIIIGAGHAGIEAGLAAARLKKKTLMLTISMDSVGHMPCNPAIGGTGKGQLVREVDALGGQMGITADKTAIQTKMLNKSKGAAVHSPIAQSDKEKYHKEMLKILKKQTYLTLIEDEAVKLLTKKIKKPISNEKIEGIIAKKAGEFYAKKVIITTGTYL